MRAPSERLDSWKAIADYLGRDERTVRRWEKTLGLPIRRVPGGRGHSVFAYVAEVEAWLQAEPATGHGDRAPAAGRGHDHHGGEAATVSADRGVNGSARVWRWSLAAIATLALAAAGITWAAQRSAVEPALNVSVTDTSVIATDGTGIERWRYAFDAGVRVFLPEHPQRAQTTASGDVLVRIVMREQPSGGVMFGGRMLALSPHGRLLHAFEFDDLVTFGAGAFATPWAVTDIRARALDGRQIVVVAAHHHQWWPGLVTVLDDDWRRLGTFVNAGWVESLDWLPDGNLLAAGYSNARGGGMVVVLDPRSITGQSPEPAGSPFHCESCGPGTPLRYIVFPRSELNRATASGFNRAVVTTLPDRVLVSTAEAPLGGGEMVAAVYELSPSMDLLRAAYDDRYWDLHRALEAQGVLGHSAELCPDRDGPPLIEVWEPLDGWRQVVPARAR